MRKKKINDFVSWNEHNMLLHFENKLQKQFLILTNIADKQPHKKFDMNISTQNLFLTAAISLSLFWMMNNLSLINKLSFPYLNCFKI